MAAGIGAIGSIGSAAISGKGASKAAKIQAQTADKEMALETQFYNDSVKRYTPEINSGDSASTLYNSAIGNGGDSTAAANALAAFQGSTGYQTTLQNDMNAVNASAYSAGLGRSGAALKALQDRGAYDAQQSYQNWLGNLNTSVQTGEAAKSSLTGVENSTTQASADATKSAGDAASTAAVNSSAAWAKALGNITQSGTSGASSYGTSQLGNILAGLLG